MHSAATRLTRGTSGATGGGLVRCAGLHGDAVARRRVTNLQREYSRWHEEHGASTVRAQTHTLDTLQETLDAVRCPTALGDLRDLMFTAPVFRTLGVGTLVELWSSMRKTLRYIPAAFGEDQDKST
jgi:hypothetical protein